MDKKELLLKQDLIHDWEVIVMGYSKSHGSTSARMNCIICGKRTGTYLSINQYKKDSDIRINSEISIPVCNGDHYRKVAEQEEVLVGYAKSINKLINTLK